MLDGVSDTAKMIDGDAVRDVAGATGRAGHRPRRASAAPGIRRAGHRPRRASGAPGIGRASETLRVGDPPQGD
jgi:hypothetical protein